MKFFYAYLIPTLYPNLVSHLSFLSVGYHLRPCLAIRRLIVEATKEYLYRPRSKPNDWARRLTNIVNCAVWSIGPIRLKTDALLPNRLCSESYLSGSSGSSPPTRKCDQLRWNPQIYTTPVSQLSSLAVLYAPDLRELRALVWFWFFRTRISSV